MGGDDEEEEDEDGAGVEVDVIDGGRMSFDEVVMGRASGDGGGDAVMRLESDDG